MTWKQESWGGWRGQGEWWGSTDGWQAWGGDTGHWNAGRWPRRSGARHARSQEATNTDPAEDSSAQQPAESAAAEEAPKAPDNLKVIANRMGGQRLEVELPFSALVGELILRLSSLVDSQPWQLRLILSDATLLEDPSLPLRDLAKGTELELTLIATRGMPEHVKTNSIQLFGLLEGEEVRQAIALLKEGKVNVNMKGDVKHFAKGKRTGGASMLQVAAEALESKDALAVSRALLQMGAKASNADAAGVQPLHVACQLGKGRLAQLLIANGADVAAELPRGKSRPLHLALKHFLSNDVIARDDAALAEACVCMVKGSGKAVNGDGQAPLAMARRALGEAVAKVLSGWKVLQKKAIRREEVLAVCCVPRPLMLAFGEELWEDWPRGFMPEPNVFIEKCFVD